MQLRCVVRIPGAKRLTVSFDPQTATEGGCDWIRFYSDSAHNDTIPGADQFTGGKDGASSNWPGVLDRPPFVVEGDSFHVYL